jgi:rhamnogalacturonyl hydrolase YesR
MCEVSSRRSSSPHDHWGDSLYMALRTYARLPIRESRRLKADKVLVHRVIQCEASINSQAILSYTHRGQRNQR